MLKLNLKHVSGMTVMEVLICTLILFLLISASSQILIWGLRISHEEKGMSYIRSEASKSIKWLITDLRQTSSASLYVADNFDNADTPVVHIPVSISFLSGIGDDAIGMQFDLNTGKVIWKNFVIYYLYPDPEYPPPVQKYLLVRKSFYDIDTTTGAYYYPIFYDFVAEHMKESDNAVFCNKDITMHTVVTGTQKINSRIIARNIAELYMPEVNVNQNYCTLTVKTKDKSINGGELEANYTTTVIMRNSF